MAKLKIEGIWKGVLDVDLETWTILMLTNEISKKSNVNPNFIKLIYFGMIINDGDGQEKLTELYIKDNANILVASIDGGQGEFIRQDITDEKERSSPDITDQKERSNSDITNQEERSSQDITNEDKRFSQLNMIKEAATELTKKYGNSLIPLHAGVEKHAEMIRGKPVTFSQRAMMMGMRLDMNAKRLIKQQNFQDALTLLGMAEEAFSLADPVTIQGLDNLPVLHLNIVWCYFMMQDINSLSEAGKHLKMAWAGIKRVYSDLETLTKLEEGLALFLRLELLEGVIAYHNGRLDRARPSLVAAQNIIVKLRMRDEKLSKLMSMGFPKHEAKRALKIRNQHLEDAAGYLFEQKAMKEEMERKIRRREAILEQQHYRRTLNKTINPKNLQDLVSIGYEKELAAEALRENGDDFHKSLDALANPQITADLQINIESRKRKREEANEAEVEMLVEMGFERSRAIAAFEAGGSVNGALEILVPEPTMQAKADPSAGPSGTASSFSHLLLTASVADVERSLHLSDAPEREVMEEDEIFIPPMNETNALYDFGTDITLEEKAIAEYFSLVKRAEAGSKGKEKVYDC